MRSVPNGPAVRNAGARSNDTTPSTAPRPVRRRRILRTGGSLVKRFAHNDFRTKASVSENEVAPTYLYPTDLRQGMANRA